MNFVSQACLLRPSTLMTRNAFSCFRNVEAMSAFCKIKNWHVWRNIYQQQFARIQKFVLPIVYPYGLVPLHDSRGDAWVAPPACYNLRRPRDFSTSVIRQTDSEVRFTLRAFKWPGRKCRRFELIANSFLPPFNKSRWSFVEYFIQTVTLSYLSLIFITH